MVTRVIVNGANGRMGSLACETIIKHPDFELAAGLNRNGNIRQAIKETNAQIVIDLTRADCVYENSLAIIESGAHPVIGTSGLQHEQVLELQKICANKKLGGIIVPNFSISAVLMMQFAAQAARYLSHVEIIETHHLQKYDAPSGTAMKTADMIAKVRTAMKEELPTQELIPGVLGGKYQNIPIHSLRLPGVLANQQVIFGSVGETLTITHNSIDRSSFMPGIVFCCQQVVHLNQLYYGLEQILES